MYGEVPPVGVAVKVTEAPAAGEVELAERLREKGVVPTLMSTKKDSVELPTES